MTSSRARGWLTACAAVASAALLTSCTSNGSAGAAASTPSRSSGLSEPTRPSEPSEPSQSEAELTEQAQAALAAVQGGTMVEAGAERVGDGVHAEPLLNAGGGEVYRFRLVCVGSGSVRMVVRPAGAGQKATVPCDGAVTQQRLPGSERLRIDVDGGKGATGMIAWQIDTV
ncbi:MULTISPECIES: hypothetical protein [Streptomyces]|uniref:Lipoprotein n=1 Tax=Streptomyces caniscabiei TaxID=2746961 RepID=A0ABU4MVP3_9ACTN|nr:MULTISPECIES: hypothetical protein [Streptomyces]MDX2943731.1 hypothetical protein [Streptomyces caniscabiei]MDX2950822.1 hypothetical protein [Streptomyces caniscabiei]MDX2986735.1 hypothetical protein [Streptomyces caniscabiei]MDX3010211.1 hypothetical protein [Streptomyces caniscabiei]MDX3040228.1 hypothetical protein [Streptomyces caniscabiei]